MRSLADHFAAFAKTVPMPRCVKPPPLLSPIDELRALPRYTETDGSQWVRADQLDQLLERRFAG